MERIGSNTGRPTTNTTRCCRPAASDARSQLTPTQGSSSSRGQFSTRSCFDWRIQYSYAVTPASMFRVRNTNENACTLVRQINIRNKDAKYTHAGHLEHTAVLHISSAAPWFIIYSSLLLIGSCSRLGNGNIVPESRGQGGAKERRKRKGLSRWFSKQELTHPTKVIKSSSSRSSLKNVLKPNENILVPGAVRVKIEASITRDPPVSGIP